MKGLHSVTVDLCYSTFGIIFFIIFASQKAIIKLWRSWSGPYVRFMLVETDVNFRALALIGEIHQRQNNL
jgi:hypothetical protein